jgi:hypothetical protein
MELADVMTQLEAMGNESAKPMLMRHGAREPFFAARIGDLKAIVKQVKKDQQLALALYATGNSDAMYLAGLIADDAAFTKEELQRWAEQAYWSLLSESTVAWVAAGNRHGWELALAWIDSDQEMLAAAGWSTLCGIVAMRPDSGAEHHPHLPAQPRALCHEQLCDQRRRLCPPVARAGLRRGGGCGRRPGRHGGDCLQSAFCAGLHSEDGGPGHDWQETQDGEVLAVGCGLPKRGLLGIRMPGRPNPPKGQKTGGRSPKKLPACELKLLP